MFFYVNVLVVTYALSEGVSQGGGGGLSFDRIRSL